MRQATESLDAAPGPVRNLTGAVVGGRFRIEALLALEGGTAVYRASDTESESPWAVRVIPMSIIAGGPERLLAQLEKTQALRHKNLVDVEAVGREEDFLFVASELIDGQSLREFIDSKRAEGRVVSLKGAANLVAHVANALDHAKRTTVHGALNPALITVSRTGRVKVSALGLASGVPTLARHGAPSGFSDRIYVAPEVLNGAAAPTAMSDVYGLGIILYELLTGQPPGSPYLAPSAAVRDVPAAIDGVIERALRGDPDARWPSATALKEALNVAAGFAAGDSLPTAPVAVNRKPLPGLPPAPAATLAPAATQPAAATNFPSAVAGPSPAPFAVAGRNAHDRAGAASAAVVAATGLGQIAAHPASSSLAQRRGSPVGLPVPGPDDHLERWLVQKDRLDFGPFSMSQLRAQIEKGEVLGEHTLIDNEAGTRCRVKEYPGLGELAKSAHRRLEQARRVQAEHRSVKSEKTKSFATRVIVGAVLCAVLGAGGLYVISRRDSAGGHLASREEEAEIETFLKGVKIGGMKASVRKASHRAAGSGTTSGGAAEDFNNDANFGDATRGAAEGDQTLDDDQIQTTMMANYRKLIPCIAHGGVSEIAMEFVVRGTGKVSAVKVNGQRAGMLPGCLLGRMQSFNFPKFNGSKTIASWSMSMGR